MPNAEALRKTAEAKRLRAHALDEKDTATNLRRRAAEADKRAEQLQQKARNTEASDGEAIAGVIFAAIIVGGLIYLFA